MTSKQDSRYYIVGTILGSRPFGVEKTPETAVGWIVPANTLEQAVFALRLITLGVEATGGKLEIDYISNRRMRGVEYQEIRP